MGKYDDYGVPLTKREAIGVAVILGAAFTCWIAIVSFVVYKLLH